jgi:hypothetical protein
MSKIYTIITRWDSKRNYSKSNRKFATTGIRLFPLSKLKPVNNKAGAHELASEWSSVVGERTSWRHRSICVKSVCVISLAVVLFCQKSAGVNLRLLVWLLKVDVIPRSSLLLMRSNTASAGELSVVWHPNLREKLTESGSRNKPVSYSTLSYCFHFDVDYSLLEVSPSLVTYPDNISIIAYWCSLFH